MSTVQAGRAIDRQQRRCWRFGAAVFDESRWSLTIDGERVALETKPLEVLQELLLRAGEIVSKSELLDSVWPNVAVVEASLPTAIAKLRRALRDDDPENPVVETVPRIGYRLAAPVTVQRIGAVSLVPSIVDLPTDCDARTTQRVAAKRWLVAGVGLILLVIAAGVILRTTPGPAVATTGQAAAFTQSDAKNAIRRLDVQRVDTLIAAGWNPNTPFDKEGDTALGLAMEICEWNPGHDRQALLAMARTLVDGGARLDTRNAFGDTAYSIAAAKRYCGPDHPATRFLRSVCFAGGNPLGDKCLAAYQLRRKLIG